MKKMMKKCRTLVLYLNEKKSQNEEKIDDEKIAGKQVLDKSVD